MSSVSKHTGIQAGTTSATRTGGRARAGRCFKCFAKEPCTYRRLQQRSCSIDHPQAAAGATAILRADDLLELRVLECVQDTPVPAPPTPARLLSTASGSTAGRDRQARASSKGNRLDNSRCISCLLVCAFLASRLNFAEPFHAARVTNLHRVVPSTRAVISARGHSHRASLLNVLAPDWLQLAGVR